MSESNSQAAAVTRIWVDPPSGWKYGFPKIYDGSKDNSDVYEWIIEQGYPRTLAESYKNHFCYRMWEASENDRS